MVKKKTFDSGQSGDHVEPVDSHSMCVAVSDAGMMQRKLTDHSGHCEYRRMLPIKGLKSRLEDQGIKILLINQVIYRDSLEECEQCNYYLGPMPTMAEVKKRKK